VQQCSFSRELKPTSAIAQLASRLANGMAGSASLSVIVAERSSSLTKSAR
jgi:hypothetical protein